MSTRILSALASCLLAGAAVAQTPISGPLSDSTTGPLLAGVVYHATGGVSLSPGATLTVQAGAIVKFPTFGTFEVSGTLLCQGTAVSPVIFTDIADDSAGGDTNGDGPSSGTAGQWVYLRMYGSASASVLDHLEVRYAGAFNWAGITLSGSSPTLRDCVVRNCATSGMDGFISSSPIVERCHFQDNAGAAVTGFWLQHIAGFSQCTASGNAGGNYQLMTGQSVSGDVVVEPDDLIGGVACLAGSVVMNAGNSLTLKAGVILKMGANATWEISGKLVTQGTSLAPVVLTDIADDSAGGDTNSDGPSSGTAGHWVYVRIYNSASASVLDHLEVRYAGGFNWAGIQLNGSSPTLRDCVVRNCATAGMDGLGVSTPIVERCHFQDNADAAVTGMLLEQLAGFSQCTASGNVGGNYQRVANGVVLGNAVVQTDDLIGSVVVLTGGLSVQPAASLTLGPGVIVKMSTNSLWDVQGDLTVQGTAAQPVVVTTLADDVYGGDTNLNGPSSGTPGAWIGMWLQGSQPATPIAHLLVRYAGGNGYSAVIEYAAGGYALSDTRIEYSQANGFELSNHAGEARGLVAWKCAGTGIQLLGGNFKLRQATVVACGTGITRSAGFAGTVSDSIAWNNTGSNTSGFTAGLWRFSNGNAGLVGVDGNIAVIPQFVDELNGDFELQAASACVNSGDPLSPLDPDGSRADMGAYPLNSCTPTVYCVGKTNSCGSVPSISWSGAMHAASGSGFVVKVTQAPGARSGLCFYGSSGAASLPFLGGTLCVQPPLNRSSTVSDTTGTPGQCNGVLQLDFAAFASGSLGGNPAPWLSLPGQYVWCQFWGRDQPAGATMLSDALSFRVCP